MKYRNMLWLLLMLAATVNGQGLFENPVAVDIRLGEPADSGSVIILINLDIPPGVHVYGDRIP